MGLLTETIQQQGSDRSTQQAGRNHTDMHPGTHTRTRAARRSQISQVVFNYNNIQMVQCKYHSRPAANLITLHWWHLFYDYSTSPRRNPSSLVNVLQSAQGDRIGPGRWPAGAASAPMPTSVRDNPVQSQKFPQLLPSQEEFLTSETKIASLVLWNSVCCNVVTKGLLVTEVCGGDPLSILYRIPLPQDQKFTSSLSGLGMSISTVRSSLRRSIQAGLGLPVPPLLEPAAQGLASSVSATTRGRRDGFST